MPFVDQDHRQEPDLAIPGDRCYVHYRAMIQAWKESPRWTTIDAMLDNFIVDEDERAFFLAFLVFFAEHGMPYERAKRFENGDIYG